MEERMDSLTYDFKATLTNFPVELSDMRRKFAETPFTPELKVDGVYKHLEQVLKVRKLVFTENSIFQFVNIDFDWVAIYAEKIELNGPGRIERAQPNLDGKPGAGGAHGAPPGKGYGKHGNPGQDGLWGLPGESQRTPEFFLFSKQLWWKGRQAQPSDVKFILAFDGCEGGKGGDGGPGGNGSNGTKGSPSRDGWIDCSSGPGTGGNGGYGGRGAVGGVGGHGTDGAAVHRFVAPSQYAAFEAMEISNNGGRPGRNGSRGKPGIPGKGGPEGDLSGKCGSAGRNGQNGIVPQNCPEPDYTGRSGVQGPKFPPVAFDDFDALEG